MPERDLPDVYFGTATTPLPKWREHPEVDSEDDDEVLAETPEDVINLLGFDPLDEDDA